MGNSVCGKSPSFVLCCTTEIKNKNYQKSILSDDLKKCAYYEKEYRKLLVLRLRRHLEGKDLSPSEMKEYIQSATLFEELATKISGETPEEGYKERIKEDCSCKLELRKIETECHLLDILYGMIQAEVIYNILNTPKLLGRTLGDCADDITKAIKESKIDMRNLQKKTVELANVSEPAIQNWWNWSII